MKRLILGVTGACVLLAALAVTLAAALGHDSSDDVATVAGHPVTRAELLFHMRRLAPTVQNELRTRYSLVGTPTWNTEVGGRTALQRLEDRALEEIRHDKTLLVLAKEQGLVDSVDHRAFLADLDDENDSRAQAMAAGRTVYGVARFSAEEYYTHRLTALTTALEQRLGKGADAPLHVTDAEVRRAFDADRDDWSANATTYTYARLVVPVRKGTSAESLQRRVRAAGSLAAVADAEPGARLTRATYDPGASGGPNAHDQDLAAVLGKLAPGGISAPVRGTGQITYYELDGRKVDEDKAFAAYSRRIRQSLVQEKFDQYLQRRVDRSDIDVDTSAVDAIKAEEVQP
ncbi:peptidyl-prolyl cis-trans isomerase [Streptomyces sp. NPDC005820]|uniref:peptidyl-prolyl cis-trans isomerase n=1 Tax=Streptomyces sp. NPDC005820 TaxID=3157069 RepID=UPI0033D96AF4